WEPTATALRADNGPLQGPRWPDVRAVAVQVLACLRAAQGQGGAAVIGRPADRQWRRPTGRGKGVGLPREAARAPPRPAVGGLEHARGGEASLGGNDKEKIDPLVLMQGGGLEILEVLIGASRRAVLPGPWLALGLPSGAVAVEPPTACKRAILG